MTEPTQIFDQPVVDAQKSVEADLQSLGLVPRAEFLEGPPRDLTEHEQDQWLEDHDGQFVDGTGQVFTAHIALEDCEQGSPPAPLPFSCRRVRERA